MYSDRWHEIESLYHLARQKAPEDRTAYLKRACEGDESLRREVESLLSLDKEAATFLETEEIPVTQGTADPSLRGGEQIGPYTIQGFLEKGGMGEVYKARDTRLDRTVAVKFLPASFAEDPAALGRFEREARAASALNHPRICTIHDIGEYQGRPFLVMEFLSGRSLRDYIAGKPVPVREIVDLSGANDSRFLDAVGESGHPLSKHYDDFLPDWRAVRHRRMRMSRDDVEQGATGHLRLTPSSDPAR